MGSLSHFDQRGKRKRGRPPKSEESAYVARQRAHAIIMAKMQQREIEWRWPIYKCPILGPKKRIPAGSPVLGIDSCRRCGLPFSRLYRTLINGGDMP